MSRVEFTYSAYKNLMNLLQTGGYRVCSYHNWQDAARCVILRHDIDSSLDQALELARVEQKLGLSSTYFVLLSSDFYNVASRSSRDKLRALREMGHEVGLHFDEKAYPEGTTAETTARILKERDILSALLETPVTTVSMHRPSQATLEADLVIPGMINSYGRTFFHDFKYLSDSRRRWREPVEEIIRSGEYDRLHILTHAFWYHEADESITETVSAFIRSANAERYGQMQENITDLASIVMRDRCL